MKDFFSGCFEWCRDCKYRKFFLVLTIAVLAIGTVGFGFTGEKAQKIKVQKIEEKAVRQKNIGCDKEELNPLRKETYPNLNEAVKEHFVELQKAEKNFAEKYNNIHIYTKAGQYYGTYIVFAEYQMKIKDIYTEVPGLAVLYAVRDEKSGQYDIGTDMPGDMDMSYVQSLTTHKDVTELLTKAEEQYETAVKSDALLKEALADLQNAYKSLES